MRTLRIVPALAGQTWHAGHDPAGHVRVELDGPGRDVRVALLPGWRLRPGPRALGPAVVAAHEQAVIARMTAWVLQGTTGPPIPDGSAAEQAALVADAHREMPDFRRRLDELRAAPVTVRAPSGIRVDVRQGRPVAVRVGRSDPGDDESLAAAVAAGLRAALAAVACQPAEALGPCPALRVLLGSTPVPLPFALLPLAL